MRELDADRQYMGNRLMYSRILDLYKQYGILDS